MSETLRVIVISLSSIAGFCIGMLLCKAFGFYIIPFLKEIPSKIKRYKKGCIYYKRGFCGINNPAWREIDSCEFCQDYRKRKGKPNHSSTIMH